MNCKFVMKMSKSTGINKSMIFISPLEQIVLKETTKFN